jgi:hypothetical protein
MIALAAFSCPKIIKERVVDDPGKTIQTIKQCVDYSITEMGYEDTIIDEQEVVSEVISSINMGDDYFLKDGTVLYQYGNLTGIHKTIGGEGFAAEGKFEGNYRVTGFVIMHGKELIDYIEDFDGNLDEPNLGEYVEEKCREKGIDPRDVEIRLHFGVNNKDRAGWMDATDLVLTHVDNIQTIEQTPVKGKTYNGTLSDFTGDTIALANGVNVVIRDNSGKLLPSGTTVIGSDGNEYIIEQLVEDKVVENTETGPITHT